MHMYEPIGYQEGHKLSDKAERVSTSFNDRQKYMSLHGQQKEGPTEYQEPESHVAKDTRAAGNTEVKGSLDCHAQNDELKKMRRCLCVLSLLVAILFLITVSSLALAAYGFDSQRNSISTLNSDVSTVRSSVNTINSRLSGINSSVSTVRSSVNTINSRLSGINSSVSTVRSSVNTINSQFSEIDSSVSTVRSSVNNLQNQLNSNVSSLQLALRSQPSKYIKGLSHP